jgi:hypothetical protein
VSNQLQLFQFDTYAIEPNWDGVIHEEHRTGLQYCSACFPKFMADRPCFKVEKTGLINTWCAGCRRDL